IVKGVPVLGDLAVQVIRVRIGEDKETGLITILRAIEGLTVLGTKGLKGVRVEGSRLASAVVKKGIMPMSVENQ
ncbi:hypothetical protein A2U01_0104168, partial [Trifolium medium]|nr:hypothetical protein [Trifolium medium]